jgi:hypothetical protein
LRRKETLVARLLEEWFTQWDISYGIKRRGECMEHLDINSFLRSIVTLQVTWRGVFWTADYRFTWNSIYLRWFQDCSFLKL